MTVREASRTAVLVCQARAVADGRLATGRFSDPVAAHLLRDAERVAVDRARSGAKPETWRERLEAAVLNRNTRVLAPRTVVIDDAVGTAANPQLVIIGAGLDSRAYRLPELAEVDVYEVDHPASQQDKRDRINGRRPFAKSLTYVSVDLSRDPLGPELSMGGHDATTPTTWILEGVLPYLPETDVHTTFQMIDEGSAPGSRLILTYSIPNRLVAIRDSAQRVVSQFIGAQYPYEKERPVSSWGPEAIRTLAIAHNFAVTYDQDLHSIARKLGMYARPPRVGRVAIADKQTPR